MGTNRLAHKYLILLDLMAAILLIVEFAHLHMKPIQWYLKQHLTRVLPSYFNSSLLDMSWSRL